MLSPGPVLEDRVGVCWMMNTNKVLFDTMDVLKYHKKIHCPFTVKFDGCKYFLHVLVSIVS